MTVTDIAARIHPELRALRREIHADPEIGNDNPRTQQRILAALDGLGLEITRLDDPTGVIAVLRGEAPVTGERPVVLLRADTDGLPVVEETGQPFASTTGAMHACGHDLHVAGLVGAAKILHELREELPGDVVFMFQPGEEGPGGAAPMIEQGVLDAAGRRAGAAFGLHVSSSWHPMGVWSGRPGAQMAASDQCYITVHGRGGHGSMPQFTLDPVPVACEIVLALQSLVTRQFDAFDPVVITVGKIAGGSKENIISDTATMDMTIRTFSEKHHGAVPERIQRLAQGIAEAHGMTAEVDYVRGYPVTMNDPAAYDLMVGAITDLFGPERFSLDESPMAGAEDFSFVAQQVPSAFMFVSAYPGEDYLTSATNHSPRALFDDDVLADNAALLAEVAIRSLAQGVRPTAD